MHCLLNRNQSQKKERFLDLALLGPFTDPNDRFLYPFIYFSEWNPYPFLYLKPEKGTPFGRSLSVKAIIGSTTRGDYKRLQHKHRVRRYSPNIHGDPRIEGYHYCICHSQGTAFETLLALNYNSFILTVAIIGVGIYSIEAGGYNVFDSHARDMYHNSQVKGHVYCWKYHPCIN